MMQPSDPNPTPTYRSYYLNFTPCAIGTFYSRDTGEVRPAPCGSWNCVDCGPRKSRRFQARIAPSKWSYMVTLTLDGEGSASTANVKRLNRNWRVFKRWLQRSAKLRDFAWVNEQGKKHGRIHKHALVQSSTFSYRRARAAVLRAGFGPVCDFSRVRSQRAVRSYVSKYLTKSLAVRWPKYSRRCQTSLPATKSNEAWAFQPALKGIPAFQHLPRFDEVAALAIEQRNAEFERNHESWPDSSIQLALIPNSKKCVTERDAGSETNANYNLFPLRGG